MSQASAPLCISTGDPGGVGPEISLRAATRFEGNPLVLYGDADALERLATRLGLAPSLRRLRHAADATPGELGLVHVGVSWDAAALRHEPTPSGGRAQLCALDRAIADVRATPGAALVTAPMSKEAVNLGGAPFVGHTEHLARSAGLDDDAVTMMFLGPHLRVALVTTHLAVADLPAAITGTRVERSVRHMAEVLLRFAGAEPAHAPRLLVTGLNPHAGEGGLFGTEERDAIAPALGALQRQPPFVDGRVRVLGPVPAETAFRLAASGEAEGVVAMLHDQATIASKLLDWTQAVNVTWGLPFVRTSVDHGVAYAAAASGTVDPAGMGAALEMARRLTAFV